MTELNTGPFQEYADLELEKRRLDRRLKKVKGRMKQLEPRLKQQLDETGMRNVPLTGKGTIHLNRGGWARVVKSNPDADSPSDADKARAIAALKAAGLGDLISEGFNTQTLSGVFREWDKQQQDPPPELEGAIAFEREFNVGFKVAPGVDTHEGDTPYV